MIWRNPTNTLPYPWSKLEATVSTSVQSRVTLYLGSLPLRTATETKGPRLCVLWPDFGDSTGPSSITGCDARVSQTPQRSALHSPAGWWAQKRAERTESLGKGRDGAAFNTVTDTAVSWLSSGWLSGLELFGFLWSFQYSVGLTV